MANSIEIERYIIGNIGIANSKLQYLINKVSMLVLQGKSKEQILNNESLTSIYHELRTYEQNFTLEHIVDYVFSRSEITHGFSLWVAFDYMLPLNIVNYVGFIKTEYDIHANSTKLASMIFFLLTYYSLPTRIRFINKELKEIRATSSYNYNEKLAETYRTLARHKQNAVILYSKKDFLNHIDISRITFNKYIAKLNSILGINNRSRVLGIEENVFLTRTYLFNLHRLYKSVARFIKDSGSELNKLGNNVNYTQILGDYSPNPNIIKMWELYFHHTLRNKKHALYYSMQPHDNIPFLRLRREGKRIKCYIPVDLANFNFIIKALYENADIVSDNEIQKGLSRYFQSGADFEEQIKVKFRELGIANFRYKDKHRYSKIYQDEKHYSQIRKSFKVVDKLSRAGIAVNKDVLLTLKRQLGSSSSLKQAQKLEKGYVEKMLMQLHDIKNDSNTPPRIYSLFTPHGASTHRMTSSNISLHGIPKSLANKIFIAPPGKSLFSVDVSGQDFMITMELGYRIFSKDSRKYPQDLENILLHTQDDFWATFERINNDAHFARPIDYLTELIYNELSDNCAFVQHQQIRKAIKLMMYTQFYGGGQKKMQTAVKHAIDSNKLSPNEIENALNKVIFHGFNQIGITDFYYSLVEKQMRPCVIIDNFLRGKNLDLPIENIDIQVLLNTFCRFLTSENLTVKTVNEFCNFNNNSFQCSLDENSELENCSALIKDLFTDKFVHEYKGVEQVLRFLKSFYNYYKVTYPSLLNWKTVVSERIMSKSNFTASISYPVQASGAELMRQWLLNLSTNISRNKQNITIVNAIHDQIIVEAHQDMENKVRKLLKHSINQAAKDLGIHLQLLKLGVMEILP